jgi:hypothetical protein
MFKDFKTWEVAFVIFLCLAGTFLFGMSVNSYINTHRVTPRGLPFYTELTNDSADFRQCENKSIVKTAFCLKEYIDNFYNYTPRNESNYSEGEGTLEDIKKNGGDCTDYANLFGEMAKELGFRSLIVTIDREDRLYGHQFAIMYDANLTHYCHFDVADKETWLVCYQARALPIGLLGLNQTNQTNETFK